MGYVRSLSLRTNLSHFISSHIPPAPSRSPLTIHHFLALTEKLQTSHDLHFVHFCTECNLGGVSQIREDSERKPLKERRTEIIRRAAFELITERGYSAVTVEDIAERAGVSRRTIFNYFPSKSDMLGVLPQPLSPTEAALIEDSSLPFFEGLNQTLRIRFAHTPLNMRYFRAFKDILAHNPEVRSVLDDYLHRNTADLRHSYARRFNTEETDPRVTAAVQLAQAVERAAIADWMRNSATPGICPFLPDEAHTTRESTTSSFHGLNTENDEEKNTLDLYAALDRVIAAFSEITTHTHPHEVSSRRSSQPISTRKAD